MSCFENIRGFSAVSMLDWPGKICSVLFLGGCNFRCPYCHNPELLDGGFDRGTVSWDDVSSYLERRSGWVDGVSITGGEPTLNSDLRDLCEEIRGLGMMVKVDTNGSRPQLIREIFADRLLDCVAMDVKTSLKKYPHVVRRPLDTGKIEESIAAIISSNVEHEFRCTVVPGLVEFSDLESISRMVAGAQCLVLQQFRSGETLDPYYTGKQGYAEEVLLEWADILSSRVPTVVRGLVGIY